MRTVDEKFIIRMPAGMRDRIRQEATANRRTMNAEIIHYIDRALAADKTETATVQPARAE